MYLVITDKKIKDMFEDILKDFFSVEDEEKALLNTATNVLHSLLLCAEKESEENNLTVYDYLMEKIDLKVKILPLDIRHSVKAELNTDFSKFTDVKISTIKDYARYRKELMRRIVDYDISAYEKGMDNIISKLDKSKPYEDMTKEELIAELKKYNK